MRVSQTLNPNKPAPVQKTKKQRPDRGRTKGIPAEHVPAARAHMKEYGRNVNMWALDAELDTVAQNYARERGWGIGSWSAAR